MGCLDNSNDKLFNNFNSLKYAIIDLIFVMM